MLIAYLLTKALKKQVEGAYVSKGFLNRIRFINLGCYKIGMLIRRKENNISEDKYTDLLALNSDNGFWDYTLFLIH